MYLQRRHNEKSLQPLGQIGFTDSKDEISVLIKNVGIGPMIIDKVEFQAQSQLSTDIEKHLSLNPKSYMHFVVDKEFKVTLLPQANMAVFSTNVSRMTDDQVSLIRSELASLRIKVSYLSIYERRFDVERGLGWFGRHERTISKA
ncbi:hypothetical protein LZD49_18480 [Dyadobacter sp. CY261]|uniref:hypothetical protein n=1 Tax=Dyadobacter sp. CY261 TaxID=2907203 RepID=UPI001F289818|nr:hypothetical protein [Dyadobacter sp. CY261]MCF0072475.1 hypothetical protein [Dyadobacter sp. CY261]